MKRELVAEKKIPSALPIYCAAAAFLLCAVVLPIYELWALLAALIAAGACWGVAAWLIPPRVVKTELRFDTGQADIDMMLTGVRDQLAQLDLLNLKIDDAYLSTQIDRMHRAGQSILQLAVQQPQKAKMIRRFADYYLPTAIKVMQHYADMEHLNAAGENARRMSQTIKENAQMIAAVFEAQLDAMFAGAVLDVSSDLEVLQTIAGTDGIGTDQTLDEEEVPAPKLIL